MRLLIAAIALLVIGVMFGSIAAWVLGWSSFKLAQGDLRCEGAGAVVINIAGEDYAVNGLAGWQYPPVQIVWNKASYPDADLDRILIRGLKLCDW
jgi:hypothetical protein